MRRCCVTLLLLAALQIGLAQKVQFQTGGTVLFAPTPEAYAAAHGSGYLLPDPASPAISFKILRQPQDNVPYRLEVSSDAWLPVSDLVLEARYTVTRPSGRVLETTDWLEVGAFAEVLYTASEPNITVLVDYRVRVLGGDPAGSYERTLTYTVYDAAGLKAGTLTHPLRFVLPYTLALRLDDTVADGATATVAFDYSVDLQAYLAAMLSGLPLDITSTELNRVEVFTNNPSGYTLKVTASHLEGPTTGSFTLEHLLLKGEPVNGQTFVSSAPTMAFETVIFVASPLEPERPSDLAIRVDGNETPGDYLFELRYDLTANPLN